MCPRCKDPSSVTKRKGFFPRKTGATRRVQRYHCHRCRRTYSEQTTALTVGERKGHIDLPLFRLLNAGVSQRRSAEILGVHRTTVARKLIRLGRRCRTLNQAARLAGGGATGGTVVFDEMETFEHSKCKPVSVAVAVMEGSRRILAVHVAEMPAKGHLAALSRKRYGPRRDHRPAALRRLAADVREGAAGLTCIKSDQCPRYPGLIAREFPGVVHVAYKGRRGCVVGQGELKAGGFDPLFSLNHTCAMFRDNLKRLSRRTWCTTKRIDRLQDLMEVYAAYHNAKIGGARRPIRIHTGPLT